MNTIKSTLIILERDDENDDNVTLLLSSLSCDVVLFNLVVKLRMASLCSQCSLVLTAKLCLSFTRFTTTTVNRQIKSGDSSHKGCRKVAKSSGRNGVTFENAKKGANLEAIITVTNIHSIALHCTWIACIQSHCIIFSRGSRDLSHKVYWFYPFPFASEKSGSGRPGTSIFLLVLTGYLGSQIPYV